MPNYSHGTKLTLASVEEPPYLTVGTDVSAKYKGAFCEAKIIDVSKHVKLRVLFDGSSGSYLIDDTDLKQGSALATGTRIEAKHPEKTKQQTYVQATITKILDHSRYTVVFDDGDQCILRRNSLCLKSGKHFAESETLDQLPLTNPEHFGNPVKVGATGTEQLNTSTNVTTNNQNHHQQNNNTIPKSQQTNNHLLLSDKPRVKSSSSTTNSSSTTSEDSKSNASELVTNNRKRQYNNQDSINDNNTTKRLKKERKIAQYSTGTTTTTTTTTTTAAATTTTTARRGSTKGGKRRESINNGSKNAMDLDDNSLDSSIESGDVDSAETNVKYELIEVGVKLMVQYGKGKIQNFYEAKVNKIETNNAGKIRYFVHYTGWNNRYDEWITKNRIHSIVIDKENGSRDGKSKHSDTVAVANSTTASISSSTTTVPKTEPKEKEKEEKEKEKEKPTRTRRARQSEVYSNNATTASSKTSSAASSTTSVITTNSTISIATTASVTATSTTVSPAVSTLAITTPVTTASVTSIPVSTIPAVASALTATQSAQTTVDTNKKASVPAVSLPLTQTTSSSSKVTSTPKAELKEKEKDEKPFRTRRAKQSEVSINNTPVTSDSTQTAPSSTNSVTTNSTISIATTTSVTSSSVVSTSASTTPVVATTLTTTPVTAASSTATSSAQNKTTVDSTKDVLTAAAVILSTTTQVASSEKVKDQNSVDHPPVPKSALADGASVNETINELNPVDQHPSVINDSGRTYRFCDEIDESDCDKKISILQDRIMALRQTYTALKTELADLDRRKKRPRTERSNSDHISNCSVVCRS